MKAGLFAIGVLVLMTSCKAGYGPLEDHSAFVSAQLAEDNRTIVFSAHRFAYRAATSWRAFPDGGIPDYVTDVNLLGVYDLQTRNVNIIRREKNSEWQPDSGLFSILASKGSMALVSQGGQLRGEPFRMEVKHFLIDFKTGNAEVLNLKADLARYGREFGYIYLVNPDGTLVFVTMSQKEAQEYHSLNSSEYQNSGLVPEIWIRTVSGSYFKVASSAHYECVRNGEVIYWEPSTRDFMAFSVINRTTRKDPTFKEPGYEDVTKGVILSSDRKALEYGDKVDGQWKYERLDLKPNLLK